MTLSTAVMSPNVFGVWNVRGETEPGDLVGLAAEHRSPGDRDPSAVGHEDAGDEIDDR